MKSLPFSTQEYEGRLARAREKMSQDGLDALIVTGPGNIFYMCGFRAAATSQLSPLMALVVPRQGEPRLIIRFLELRIAEAQWTERPAHYMDHEDPFQLLGGVLDQNGIRRGRIGVEESNLTAWRLNRIRQALPATEFKDASDLVKSLLCSPSETEIAFVRRAAEIATFGFERGIGAIRPGILCCEVLNEAHRAVYEAGQTDTNIGDFWIWAGPKGGSMHNSAVDYPIHKGDMVTLEIGGVYNMYRVHAQGTVFVGSRPPREILDHYRFMAEMYKEAREAVRPGAAAGEVYERANRFYRSKTGEDYFKWMGGSMALDEFGLKLSRGNAEPLLPGVALLVQAAQVHEPAMMVIAGTIMVTDNGWEEIFKPLLELRTV